MSVALTHFLWWHKETQCLTGISQSIVLMGHNYPDPPSMSARSSCNPEAAVMATMHLHGPPYPGGEDSSLCLPSKTPFQCTAQLLRHWAVMNTGLGLVWRPFLQHARLFRHPSMAAPPAVPHQLLSSIWVVWRTLRWPSDPQRNFTFARVNICSRTNCEFIQSGDRNKSMQSLWPITTKWHSTVTNIWANYSERFKSIQNIQILTKRGLKGYNNQISDSLGIIWSALLFIVFILSL